MENIHGVDVSWLHQPTNGLQHNHVKPTTSKAPQSESRQLERFPSNNDGAGDTKEDALPRKRTAATVPTQPQPPAQTPPPQQATKPTSRRPSLLSRSSADKSLSPESANAVTPPLKKRSSFLSSLGSKLSSSGTLKASKGAPSAIPAPSNSQPLQYAVPQLSPPATDPSAFRGSAEDSEEDGDSFSSPPKGTGSFFSTTFRRLSSVAPGGAPAGAQSEAPQCQRRVLNVDEGRYRCAIKGINPAKLRRVSFSVDVEIAGSSRYPTEDEPAVDPTDSKAKKKEKKGKDRGEGEALKHPDAVKQEAERDGVVQASGEVLKKDAQKRNSHERQSLDLNATMQYDAMFQDDAPNIQRSLPQSPPLNDSFVTGTPSRPGTDGSNPAPGPAPLASIPGQSKKDRPTTDPLRIYRRCCQLREAPVLKRISEQLSSPNNCGVDSPGVVTYLNLNRSRMQLADVVCVGDWLAVVPVKKLLLDDANLTDEGVRVILAGLLAAKPPELCKRKRGRSSPTRLRDTTIQRSPGVIEKLTLKNNRKLTAEAWRYICQFLNQSRSIRAVDLSMVPFPHTPHINGFESSESVPVAIDELLYQSLTTRLGGDTLAELTFGECGLEDGHVAKITAAAAKVGLMRLVLAGNRLTDDGLRCVASYLKAGVCKGLDLGGVSLHQRLPILLDALYDLSPLQAISLANCNLDVDELTPLFDKLLVLPDFRFLDLSHNRNLFSQKPTALSILRHCLPQLQLLKRLHLMDVSLSPADAIGIAEIVPEMRNLAHLNLLENPQLTAIASATDAASSEEACALFASLMTAVRLSKTILCVDIDVPSKDASEVVRALARQVVAYCLRNMEIFTQGDAIRVADAAAALPDVSDANIGLLQDIVGHEGDVDGKGNSAPAKNEDYLVGGQGWAKALSHCLNAADLRKMSVDGQTTPHEAIESAAGKAKAKEMSKDLLASARNFRERLQVVLAREEASSGDLDVRNRLQFLDRTIISIIERFEREYPDTRLPPKPIAEPPQPGETEPIDTSLMPVITSEPSQVGAEVFSGQPSHTPASPMSNSSPRRGSATDLASFVQMSEEAQIHRLGQRFRREVLPPSGVDDRLHGTTTHDPQEPKYMVELRRQIEELGGEDLREKVAKQGWEATLQEFTEQKDRLKEEERKRVGGGA